MPDIKIFIASSEELKKERCLFSKVALDLNNVYRDRDFYFPLSKWEYLDSSMGIEHKQEEYNQELKTCDIVFVIFWRRFGDYTNIEYEMALKGLRENRLPNFVVVMFKNNGEPIEDNLAEFKKSLKPEDRLKILEFHTDEEFSSQATSMISSYVDSL